MHPGLRGRDRGEPDSAGFFRQYLRHPRQVGSVAPSSRALGHAMLHGLPDRSPRLVVEYGSGTGAFTRLMLKRFAPLPACRIVAVEPNPVFQRHLRRHYPEIRVIGDRAANVTRYIEPDLGAVDLVVSGVPFSFMPFDQVTETVRVTSRLLRDGGHFRAFVYHHTYWLPRVTVLRRLLRRSFRRVETTAVWANFPPAIVLQCEK